MCFFDSVKTRRFFFASYIIGTIAISVINVFFATREEGGIDFQHHAELICDTLELHYADDVVAAQVAEGDYSGVRDTEEY